MKVSILGSGSWGTALAQVLSDNQHEVLMWGIDLDEVVDIHKYHQNAKYFPDIYINEDIQATTDLTMIKDSEVILIATPSFTLEEICEKINSVMDHKVIIINVSKGFHPESHKRLSVVIEETIRPEILTDVVSLIGPSHAEEVIKRLQTVVSAVCENEESAKLVQYLFSNEYFRVYRTDDVIGAEIGVALKNIIAIASGVLSGIGLGDNARAALITRGLAEIKRYGIAQGGREETFLGLTGVGDLIVTCTSEHSRNFQAGYTIGKNNSARAFWQNNTKTVEGVRAAEIVYKEAQKLGISMPITEQVYRILYQDLIPQEAVVLLMTRDLKAEF